MSDLLLDVHSVTAATIVVDNARSAQKTILPASSSMGSTIGHSCSRWDWCIKQPISIIASPSTTQQHSIPTCPQRQLSRGISDDDDDDGDGNDDSNKEQQGSSSASTFSIHNQ